MDELRKLQAETNTQLWERHRDLERLMMVTGVKNDGLASPAELFDRCIVAIRDRAALSVKGEAHAGWKLVRADLLDSFPEINPSNYGQEEVDALNAWGIAVVTEAAAHSPRALALQPQDDGWKPISSAPRDGTEVDIWVSGPGPRRVPDCRWARPRLANYGDRFGNDAELEPQWTTRAGFALDQRNGEPTHFRLSPAPPAKEEGGGA